ncbi:MAG TPA: ATP-binding cassette domain-containing protein [Vicinamibacterales bacterium]|jgi:ABC-type transporter Mla maintaining outer membrane lipid asymmetry ATPase subunit MlaF|nr:ATP-binding cassette domain-containing protein [Vicinamibacterales bacterium]
MAPRSSSVVDERPVTSTRDKEAAAVADTTVSTVVEFKNVSLAFDEQVVLRDLGFSVPAGAMRILLGASGTGKSVILKLILGLLQPDSGTILVNGQRIDTMPERDLLRMRADVGMMFQENALFDSLTVGENVDYRLYEESDVPLEEVDKRVEEVLTFVGLEEFIDRMPATLSGWPAAPRRDCPGDRVESQPSAVRRPDHRARSDHRQHRG